jgi:hypothetical protein
LNGRDHARGSSFDILDLRAILQENALIQLTNPGSSHCDAYGRLHFRQWFRVCGGYQFCVCTVGRHAMFHDLASGLRLVTLHDLLRWLLSSLATERGVRSDGAVPRTDHLTGMSRDPESPPAKSRKRVLSGRSECGDERLQLVRLRERRMDRRPARDHEAPPRRAPENSLKVVAIVIAELGDHHGFIGDIDAHGAFDCTFYSFRERPYMVPRNLYPLRVVLPTEDPAAPEDGRKPNRIIAFAVYVPPKG